MTISDGQAPTAVIVRIPKDPATLAGCYQGLIAQRIAAGEITPEELAEWLAETDPQPASQDQE